MVETIFYAVVVGALIGGLGRLVIRGHQNISLVMTVVIGVVAAFVGGYLADTFGLGTAGKIDWIRLFIQVAVAAGGVALYTSQSGSRERSRGSLRRR
jgi:uncharacterized membrane protein YeaQ/YmgE (transglycosylase-associated protein family)